MQELWHSINNANAKQVDILNKISATAEMADCGMVRVENFLWMYAFNWSLDGRRSFANFMDKGFHYGEDLPVSQ